MNLEARLWMENVRERRAIGDAVTERVKQLFDEHGVEIPYPKRDIYIRSGPGGGATPPLGGG
jgi:small-conductance mechanosensitive channel